MKPLKVELRAVVHFSCPPNPDAAFVGNGNLLLIRRRLRLKLAGLHCRVF